MNIHFLSFLIDLSVWIALGVLIGRKVYFIDPKTRTGKIRNEVNYTFVSVFSGFIAILSHGLPESGFAWYDFLFVLVITFAYTMYGSMRFRRLFLKLPKTKKKNITFISLMPKGGDLINGNNS